MKVGTRLQVGVVAFDKDDNVLYERLFVREDDAEQYDFTKAISALKLHPDLVKIEMTLTWPKSH